MSANEGIRMKNLPHPGRFVKHELIDPYGLSVTGVAEVLGITRSTLSTILIVRARPSADMAVRIEKAFGVWMATLMRMLNS